jgi:transcription-repair coupling factor (superfamily II helicase)
MAESYPIDRVVDALTSEQAIEIVGASGGLKPLVVADLARRLDQTAVVITPDARSARQLASELELFVGQPDEDAGGVAWYPEYDVGPFHGATPDRQLAMRRLTTLHRLGAEDVPRPGVVVTSIGAAMRRTVPREAFLQRSYTIEFAQEWPDDALREMFAACGFTEVTTVEDPGTFAIRGDIIDVFSPGSEHPVRIERWGDDISELRSFDASSQRTIGDLERCAIFPVREEILDTENVSRARHRIRERAGELSIPSRDIKNILDDLEAGLHFIGLDALLPAVYEELEDLLGWLPDDAVLLATDPERITERAAEIVEKRTEEFERVRDEGQLVFEPSHYYRSADEWQSWLRERRRAELRRVSLTGEGDLQTFTFRARQNSDVVALRKQYRGVEETVRAVAGELPGWKNRYGRICFVCRTRGQVERLTNLLEANGETVLPFDPPIDVSEPVPPPAGVIEVYRGSLAEGFRSELISLAVISGVEVFGARVATQEPREITEHVSIQHFRDLSPGDLVVHVDFGIGRYHGLVHLEVEGVGNDFLHLEYADGDRLYLPVYRLGRVQKYIGDPSVTRLDKLGGTSWERTKERVKANIREVAGELLELYARRELRKGHAFTQPDAYFHEFEADFPYEETPDQARAIREVIGDMTRPRPMDRLVCGDVGFGKTEVAIRAAMKAVLDGRQVAVLVPTTILCEQHILSFRDRVAEFGVRVEGLSRFRTSKQTRQILEDTEKGKVDILIGTHRLLSGDIDFRDLGLLIVDEEQRFGVKHKEKIKQLKANVDVLTLTATPIPRTLQMSLLGIRDLSIITTPPHDRLAVRTHVAKFNDAVIREAIMREIARGGQVFFVHNRVKTIEEIRQHLEKVVPEARIAVGHGQMKESELEEVMVDYINGETNVLLCTAIIESGLDIPNANTIIVNRADRFGLSQLYQLRGRVGRGKERAFAYLLIPARAKLKAEAEKRLEVIQTYTDLGSGFQVATYDLEIRGAGNLLGEDQSGHVAAVGLDLYTELLEETIADMRGEEFDDQPEPEVNITLEAYIPEEYIRETSLRLMFYKRFSLSRTEDELYDSYGELGDRFGDPPEAVRNLRDIIRLKIGLRDIGASRLDAGPSNISIELTERTPIRPDKLVEWMQQSRGKVRLKKDMKVIFKLRPDESARPLQTSREFIQKLKALA